MTTIVWMCIIAGVGGAVVGSFLNVVILRTKSRSSYLRGRSRCPKCRKTLRWYELVPIVSFIILRGRCARCHKAISWQYPIVETVTALGFVLTVVRFGTAWTSAVGLVVVAAAVLLAVYDARWRLLPDEFSILFIVAGAGFSLLADQNLWFTIAGAAVGAAVFGFQYVVSRGRWVGSGDILLGAGIGALLGLSQRLLLAFFIAYVAGSIVVLSMMAAKRLSMKDAVAFGPYLLSGALIAWLYGDRLIDWFFTHVLFF